MEESERRRLYRYEAQLLGEIGAVLVNAELPRVEVRLPVELAHAAVLAWDRDDEAELDAESYEQGVVRRRAATLALVGLAVSELGHADGEEVVVNLDPVLIGIAVEAADELPPK